MLVDSCFGWLSETLEGSCRWPGRLSEDEADDVHPVDHMVDEFPDYLGQIPFSPSSQAALRNLEYGASARWMGAIVGLYLMEVLNCDPLILIPHASTCRSCPSPDPCVHPSSS